MELIFDYVVVEDRPLQPIRERERRQLKRGKINKNKIKNHLEETLKEKRDEDQRTTTNEFFNFMQSH